MSKRRSILVGTTLVAGGLLWYLFRPDALVISKTVNEPFPAMQESGSSTSQMSEMGHSTMARSSAMGEAHDPGQMAHDPEPVRLVSGRFHTNAHETEGLATIYRLDDGRRVLRLTEFATSNGPDVRVYLVAAGDVQDEDAAKRAGFVDLGALKGNIGDQNYDVPEGLDLTTYRAVSVWCRRFSVNFGAAPLADAGM
ncbi:MAG: DM13 domain-containing protein [Gemmatimonadales bacterium]